jgi:Glycosyl hydrolase family 26
VLTSVLSAGYVGVTQVGQAGAGVTGSPAFSAYVGAGNAVGLDALSGTLGYGTSIASDSFDQRSWAGIDNDQWVIQRWEQSGHRMIWAVPMLPSISGVSLAVGATGAYDSHFTLLAANLIAAGMGGSVLRIGWEFNQATSPWYAAGQPANFVNYWRQIVTTMRSVPGAHFQFEWNPNRGDSWTSDQAMGDYANYYPGDAYADIVGIDVYDLDWNNYPGVSAEFQHILTQPWGLDWISSFGAAHNKPIAIPELGLGWGASAPNSGPISASGDVCGGDNPTFIADVFDWATYNNVANVVFWDHGTSSIQNGQNPWTARALMQALTSMSTGQGSTSGAGSVLAELRYSGLGYWEVAADGGVFAFNAPFKGSMGGRHLSAPIVGIAADQATGGYWEVAADGGVFAFNAPFKGSMGGRHLSAPIVGIAADQATGGYWEVAADGGVFAFNAPFKGSMGGRHLSAPIVKMSA